MGCNKEANPDFLHTVRISFDAPANLTTLETHYFRINNVPTFLENALTIRGLTLDDIQSIKSISANLSTQQGNLDIAYLNNATAYTYLDDRRIELYYFDNIPFKSQTSLQLLPSLAELNDAIGKDFCDFEVGLRFRQGPGGSFKGTLDMEFGIFLK